MCVDYYEVDFEPDYDLDYEPDFGEQDHYIEKFLLYSYSSSEDDFY